MVINFIINELILHDTNHCLIKNKINILDHMTNTSLDRPQSVIFTT